MMNPYGVDTRDNNIRAPLVSLKVLYDVLPKTTGCEQCPSVNGDNRDWCCKRLNPSMYYAEFLYAWKEAQTWGKQRRLQLIIRAIRNYINNSLTKGCIFYTDTCNIYNKRPLTCRTYGVIPQDEWNDRIEMSKKRFGDNYSPPSQCNLVKTQDGSLVTKEMDNKWFAHTAKCEKRIGVSSTVIKNHDGDIGSYRTFHDHLLVELFENDFLNMLTAVKLNNPTQDAVDSLIAELEKDIQMVIE